MYIYFFDFQTENEFISGDQSYDVTIDPLLEEFSEKFKEEYSEDEHSEPNDLECSQDSATYEVPEKRIKLSDTNVADKNTEMLTSIMSRLEDVVKEKQNRSEFDIFGESVAAQLNNMPFKDALLLQGQIQELISQKRLKNYIDKETEINR